MSRTKTWSGIDVVVSPLSLSGVDGGSRTHYTRYDQLSYGSIRVPLGFCVDGGRAAFSTEPCARYASEVDTLAPLYLRAWKSGAWRLGPVALALFGYIGQIKAHPALAWSPIDWTLILAVVIVAASIWSHVANGPANRSVLIVIALFVILGLGLIQMSFEGYGASKVVRLYTVTLMCAVTPYYLLRTAAQRRVFLMTLAGLGLIVSVVTLVDPGHPSRASSANLLQGTDTIGTARMAATALIVVLIAVIGVHLARLALFVSLAGVTAMLATVLATQSRGPLVGLVLALACACLASPAFRRIRYRAAIGIAAGLAGLVAVILLSGLGDRIERIFAGSGDSSVDARTHYLQQSISNIPPTPWGIGWGGFPHLPGLDPGENVYPHNIVVEVGLEGGWLAGLAIIICLAWSFERARRNAVTTVETVVFALFVFTVVNALVSGDVNSNRLMWILTGYVLSTLTLPADIHDRFKGRSFSNRVFSRRKAESGLAGDSEGNSSSRASRTNKERAAES